VSKLGRGKGGYEKATWKFGCVVLVLVVVGLGVRNDRHNRAPIAGVRLRHSLAAAFPLYKLQTSDESGSTGNVWPRTSSTVRVRTRPRPLVPTHPKILDGV